MENIINSKDKVKRKYDKESESLEKPISNTKSRERILSVMGVSSSWKPIYSEEKTNKIVANVEPSISHNQVSKVFFVNRIGGKTHEVNIDIQLLAWLAHGYNMASFKAACLLKLCAGSTKATALVFPKGQVVILGAKNDCDALLCAYAVRHIVCTKLDMYLEISSFRRCNIQMTVNMKYKLDLEKLHDAVPFSAYAPDVIKNVRIRLSDKYYERNEIAGSKRLAQNLCTFSIFDTGNFTLTGLPSKHMANKILSDILPFLAQFVTEPTE